MNEPEYILCRLYGTGLSEGTTLVARGTASEVMLALLAESLPNVSPPAADPIVVEDEE